MAYATYEYYTKEYSGTAIPESLFPRMIRKASQYIDHFTFGRVSEENAASYPTLPECACDMAEVIYKKMEKSSGDGREKKSENIDGYSVTYVTENTDGITTEDALKRKLYSVAKLYLSETGLLYCGLD